MNFLYRLIQQHKNLSGVLVLDKGEEALLARAWLADHARQSIEVQYFIWSTDNIGILASEALLRAAERGVKVRVIVDDLMIDAPDKSLLALALHPNVDIRIYNPKHSVGTPWYKRVFNTVSDFRGVNQRMHDKTFVVDGKIAITGGRNMADEYFDYDQAYNFRDRDALVLGKVAASIRASFERFWNSGVAIPVEQRFDGSSMFGKQVSVSDAEVQAVYRELHEYAKQPENFKPEVRKAIQTIPQSFSDLVKRIVWTKARFISDTPGKNDGQAGLAGGGLTTTALAEVFNKAEKEVVIQSPYLVVSESALALFRQAKRRGIRIRVSTNSLASTDNLPAFSGYRNQRTMLLAMGIEVYEYQPFPKVQQQLLQRYPEYQDKPPLFAIHAKTMVVDGRTVFIGTYNLDPRSENLNTEVGLIFTDVPLAQYVRDRIVTDMKKGNSWPADENPDQHATRSKRLKVWLMQRLPIKPLL